MYEAVVVGAGHAGLAVSWHLARRGVEHVVLEQGRVGESWRSQRWDSFALNTPNGAGLLPGESVAAEPSDGFALRDAWVDRLQSYAQTNELPIREGQRVISLDAAHGDGFLLRAAGGEELRARAVVLASGFQRVPKLPHLAASLPPGIASLHTADYRRPDQLPTGAVLVVGSAQSGGQIAEDLLDAGRTVYVSASAVGRLPRRHRGRDVFEWLLPSGFMDQTVEQLADPRMRYAAQPIISGVGRLGHTLSLQLLQSRGATLLGRLQAVDGGRLRFASDLPESIRFADRVSVEIKSNIDKGLAAMGRPIPPPEPDPADEPVPDPDAWVSPAELDLEAAGIGSVIWSTGFGADLSWIRSLVTDERGLPIHDQGRSSVPGLWFLGVPWLRTRKSGIVLGADADGGAAADEVAESLAAH